ncbi:MAG: 50S ribosomal protein L10 [Actinomycetota bacterium]
MPRPEKVQAVADIKERIDEAQAVFLAEYAGLSVNDQQALRRQLRANDAEFKVVKMTLARLAAAALEIEDLDELLLGPTGLTFADGDPVGAAKALRDFAKDHEVFVIKGGLLGREFLTPERVAELADIEPRDVLLARIAGAMQAPMANMAGLLSALPRNAASAMQQLIEKKEAETQAAGEEPVPAEESSDDEAAEAAAPVAEETAEEAEAPAEEAVAEEPAEEAKAEAEEAPAEEPAEEAEPEAEEAPAEEPAEEAKAEAEEAPADDEPEAPKTESNDEAPAAEASEEDAGTESKDTDDAADKAVEEE